MAVAAAEAWLESLLASHRAFSQGGSIFAVNLEEEFEAITQALFVEHEREYGPFDEDFDPLRELYVREAGYLVGIQIGLRLRTAGGAR